ncbi:ABC transporter permease [Candidatus Adlerbacteria bacterium RIFCSPHIGHO2_02_FULL_52_17]|uniref:Transport permease protein n=1 Tax=Candidatus Adlerbacteria bacterium RIFCSPHIGHO2_02_FULL_52_17 TaxID=1797240 RepID=A0A1F4XML9_9BACT|nr:MAG: ABC transporter permease [Candidatus Adlerbacteria bacterium RIFCSPHIGHO2_02_FULL_52_17]
METNKTLIAYYTVVRKDVVRIVRLWKQTFLPSVVTTVLYFIVFGSLIGSKLPPIHGVTYIMFIVPGLVMMQVIMNAYSNTSSALFMAKFQRNLEEMLVSPMPEWVIIAGYVTAGIVRGSITGVLVLGVGLFFTHLTLHSIPIIMAAFVLTCVLFSLGGFLNAMFAESFDSISIIPTFVLTPMTFLGGVFYSIQQFPPFWQTVSLANPVLYMVNVFRYGFLGTSDVNIWLAFGVLIGLIALFIILILRLFKRGVGLKT